jgi:hypothetical protein
MQPDIHFEGFLGTDRKADVFVRRRQTGDFQRLDTAGVNSPQPHRRPAVTAVGRNTRRQFFPLNADRRDAHRSPIGSLQHLQLMTERRDLQVQSSARPHHSSEHRRKEISTDDIANRAYPFCSPPSSCRGRRLLLQLAGRRMDSRSSSMRVHRVSAIRRDSRSLTRTAFVLAPSDDRYSTFDGSISSPPSRPYTDMAPRNGWEDSLATQRRTRSHRNSSRGDTARIAYVFESRLLVTRLCRGVDRRGVWTSFEAIGEDMSCRPVEGVLFDLRESDYVPDASDAHAFAAYMISFLGRRRLAFVTQSAIQYGMARMIAADARAHRVDVRVFQDEHRAATWLCSADRDERFIKGPTQLQ